MEKYDRTFKLLFSICRGVAVVSSNWIIECEYRRTILPFNKYYLPGPERETIINSVEKVKEGFKVFQDLKFHLFS